ncbi:ATP-binding protein [Streptomyces sp. ST2-7A]|uniref:ATP-binding protein n=1 Tax=Streptomyces sp. ST2-7A TaxID=2907214 RepID=UPI0035ABBA53
MSATTDNLQPTRRWWQQFSPEPRSVPLARHQVQVALREWRCDQNDADCIVLVTSELVTNAILHGSSTERPVEVCLTLAEGSCLLEVSDSSPRGAGMRTPADTNEHGRGLLLVSQLATRNGTTFRGHIGKTVWAQMPATSCQDATMQGRWPVRWCGN